MPPARFESILRLFDADARAPCAGTEAELFRASIAASSHPQEQDCCTVGPNSFLKVLPEMVAFLRVAELGSFSAAADLLGITPSAASRQVKRLEKEIGVQLLQRTTRQLRLTEAGAEAFERCRELAAAAQDTMALAQRFSAEPRGLVRLSAPKAFARRVLHPLVLDFLARHPAVDVQLIVEDRDIDPIREGVDLVVRLTTEPPEGLVARRLMAVAHILVAAPAYLEGHAAIAHPRDLAAHSCLSLGEHERDNHWRFSRPGEDDVEVTVHGRYIANHSEMRMEAATAGLGVACVPAFSAQQALGDGRVARVLGDWEFRGNYHGHAWILYPPNRFTVPKCRVLIDHLVARLGTEG
jgi:DNA-binding transcriptional LysR family regulator